MPYKNFIPSEDMYFIIKKNDDSTIPKYGFIKNGNCLQSGQDPSTTTRETFTVKQDWLDRLAELGVTFSSDGQAIIAG